MEQQPPAKLNRKRSRHQHSVAAQCRHPSQVSPLRPLAGYIRKATLPVSLLLGLHAGAPLAGPQGDQIVGGKGKITRPDASTTSINQHTHNLAIDWSSFNIDQNELV